MKRATKLLAVGAVGVMIALVARRSGESTAGDPTCTWPRGQRYVYSLAWEAKTHLQGEAATGIPASSGTVDLAGQLELRSLGRRGDTTLLAISLPSLARHHWSVLDRELFPDDESVRATFTGHAAYVSARADGSFGGIRFDPGTPPLFRAVMAAIAPQALVTLRTGTEWEALEQGPSGRAHVRYHRRDDQLVRDRVDYRTIDALPAGMCADCRATLASTASIALADGHVATIDDREKLASRRPDGSAVLDVQSHFAIALVDVHAGAETAVDEAHLVEATPIADLEREALERRTDGLTSKALVDQLRISALTGVLGVGPEWPLRAVALIQLHPELCDQLRDLFEDPELNPVGRGMILDLLTSAGSGAAQEAMRSILASDTARADPNAYVTFVQRFAIVERPAVESAPFIDHLRSEAAEAGDRRLEVAALYTLGSVAGHLATSGDLATARGYTARFRTELHAATSADDKRALLAALGNADLSDDAGAIAEFAHDGSASVRAQVVVALRDATGPAAITALDELASDADATVAKTAWAALAHREVAADELARLDASVRDGHVPIGAGGEVTSVLAAHLADDPDAAEALAALARSTDDNALKTRIDEILHRSR